MGAQAKKLQKINVFQPGKINRHRSLPRPGKNISENSEKTFTGSCCEPCVCDDGRAFEKQTRSDIDEALSSTPVSAPSNHTKVTGMFDDPSFKYANPKGTSEASTRQSKKPIVNHPIIFFNWEDVWNFQQATKKFPVVEKKADHFALIKAFSRLDEARAYVKGTRLIVWYVPVH